MASEGQSMPFIKNLASSDRKTRESSLATLRAFLSARITSTSLSLLDILKLWKGLFYALWMADRAIPQQNLCADLSSLIDILPSSSPAVVVQWLRGFWATMAREWTTIDVLRMEKFLLLVRRVLGASLGWMRADGGGKAWDQQRVDGILGVLREWPLRTEDTIELDGAAPDEAALLPQRVPAGLKVHVVDIWVDEAEKVGLLSEEDDGEAAAVLKRLNTLVEKLQRETTATAVKVRAKEALEDDRLPWNKSRAGGLDHDGADDDDEEAQDGSWDGFND